MIRIVPLLLFILAACGPADSDPGPGGVTVEDARALDEAAAKLDAENEAVAQPTEPARQTEQR